MIGTEAEAATRTLLDSYTRTRDYTCALCSPLKAEDYLPQPEVFASPPKWHLAHTTWFFEAFILEEYSPAYKTYDSRFSQLFNSYYNNAGVRIARDRRGLISRPSVDEVYAYRQYVDEQMCRLIESGPSADILSLVELGINHEQQHQELLLTDLKYAFSCNPVKPAYVTGGARVNDTNADAGYIELDEGVYEAGFSGKGFCYDNELGRHKVYLHACRISKAYITNGDFADFIEDGGYQDFNLWLDEGWSWVQANNVLHPLYWNRTDDGWSQFSLGGIIELDPLAILAHVNYYEASAFAEWKGMRLPTEFEWEAAAPQLDWGSRWEWTGSAYLPYPHFRTAPGAIGEYNGKFMINQMVLRGASAATTPGHSRHTYRNFFHPESRWQFTGIRLAETV